MLERQRKPRLKTPPPSPQPVKYHLRYQIPPAKDVVDDAKILSSFCRKHEIEEVVLFFAGEEWNNGLLSRAEEDEWFKAVGKAKKILEANGITVSLNPWMTVLHCARGRSFPKGSGFEPTVSPVGETSKACASFAGPKWREYIYKLYGRFARLGFRVIWVEDDFRYHNHSPLTWGGGFEPDVLKRFAIKIGKKTVSRVEVLKNILAPGTPHPWRAKWMTTWREIQLEVAQGLAKVVDANSPCPTALGLMSSGPSVHSAEGRDWLALFNALKARGGVVHRPHYAPYSEAVGTSSTYSMMMLDWQKQFRPKGCEVAPEVENFPFTCWTKSDTQTWKEMALCKFHGADALLLDVFPFSGNRADDEPRIGCMLDQSRDALEWIGRHFGKGLLTDGVGLPWRQDAQQHVRLGKGATMSDLDASPLPSGDLLLRNGVPVSMRKRGVNAIFGSMAWVFDDLELREMLGGGLLLDGLAAEILELRGFGGQIGVSVLRTVDREDGKYSVERITDETYGVRKGFFLSCNNTPEMRVVALLPGAKEWTEILEPDGSRFGAGLVVYKNRLGGRVATFTARNPAQLPSSFQRQALVHSVIDFIGRSAQRFPLVSGGPHLMPIYFETSKGDGLKVAVLNGSTDPANPTLKFTWKMPIPKNVFLLSPLHKPQLSGVKSSGKAGASAFTINTAVPYQGFAVFEW